MKEKTGSTKVKWSKIKNKDCLKFTFDGNLIAIEAARAIEEWQAAFTSKNGDKVMLVWDCKKMTGYEPRARIAWQRALKELKPQIESIWLITGSAIIKAGAMIMSTFTSYQIRVVGSESEISI